MRLVIHNHMPRRALDDFRESDHPREQHGRFTSGGGSRAPAGWPGEPKGHVREGPTPPRQPKPEKVAKARRFLNSPRNVKTIAKATAAVVAEHGAGTVAHTAQHSVIHGVHEVVGIALASLGAGASVPRAVATAVVGYSVHHLMRKFGLDAHHCVEMLKSVGRRLLDSYRARADERNAPVQGRQLARDEDDYEDIIEALERFVEILENTPIEALLAAV